MHARIRTLRIADFPPAHNTNTNAHRTYIDFENVYFKKCATERGTMNTERNAEMRARCFLTRSRYARVRVHVGGEQCHFLITVRWANSGKCYVNILTSPCCLLRNVYFCFLVLICIKYVAFGNRIEKQNFKKTFYYSHLACMQNAF